MKNFLKVVFLFLGAAASLGQDAGRRLPIIDVHLHSHSLADLKEAGPNPVSGVQPLQSVEEHIRKTLEPMKRYNSIFGVASDQADSLFTYFKDTFQLPGAS